MAVAYVITLRTGLDKIEFGLGIVGACFFNGARTGIALDLIFASFTYKAPSHSLPMWIIPLRWGCITIMIIVC